MKKEFAIFSKEKPGSLLGYVAQCSPVLLFPLLYFPYSLWWRRDFSAFASAFIRDNIPAMRLLVTGNNTILLFWGLATAVVMLTAIVISIIRVRPWYIIPVYLAVMFSLCGIFSMMFYTFILG